jgi:hypothetical protein
MVTLPEPKTSWKVIELGSGTGLMGLVVSDVLKRRKEDWIQNRSGIAKEKAGDGEKGSVGDVNGKDGEKRKERDVVDEVVLTDLEGVLPLLGWNVRKWVERTKRRDDKKKLSKSHKKEDTTVEVENDDADDEELELRKGMGDLDFDYYSDVEDDDDEDEEEEEYLKVNSSSSSTENSSPPLVDSHQVNPSFQIHHAVLPWGEAIKPYLLSSSSSSTLPSPHSHSHSIPPPPYDYILLSDVTYHSPLFPILVHTLKQLSGPGTRVILAYEKRDFEKELEFFRMLGQWFWFRDVKPEEMDEEWRCEEEVYLFLGEWKKQGGSSS